MKNKRLIVILIAVAVLLCVPLIAMQFTNQVNWSPADFVVAGILLFVTGLSAEFVIRKVKNKDTQVGIIAAILLALFLVWAELALGIFGTPSAGS